MKSQEEVKVPKNSTVIERDLDALHSDVMRIVSKLSGVAGILMKASTDENGLLDLDPALNGVGYILEDCAQELEGVNEDICEHAVRIANLETALDKTMKELLLRQGGAVKNDRQRKLKSL